MPGNDTSVPAHNEKISGGETGNTLPSPPESRPSASGSVKNFGKLSAPTPGILGKSAELEMNEGWPLLARLIEKQPEFEAFPRFRELNVKNLLYYQVELDYLGERLKDEEIRDRYRGRDPEEDFYKNPIEMVRQWSRTGKCEQWELVLRLRRCLHEYNDAMLQYARVSTLPDANRLEMAELVRWITGPATGNFSISS